MSSVVDKIFEQGELLAALERNARKPKGFPTGGGSRQSSSSEGEVPEDLAKARAQHRQQQEQQSRQQ